ncbi:unnamed protein product [Hymenolepis diminuta]|uniref:Uncharacterized protein n=1 Tax=Hymenolepis diminuta TaxID=6216 RepID=A0A564YXR0_HYMDI|nr:unnamed protein product [Hymenolepis diminuta]
MSHFHCSSPIYLPCWDSTQISVPLGQGTRSQEVSSRTHICRRINANFAENVAIIEAALLNTSLLELQRQWPHRRLLPRIFYEQINEAELE